MKRWGNNKFLHHGRPLAFEAVVCGVGMRGCSVEFARTLSFRC